MTQAFIQFPDRQVPYEVFMNDLASRIVKQLKEDRNDPVMMSQRQAYRIFGRANVDRWRKQGRLQICKRPGKVEYYTAELRQQQAICQDYFKTPPPSVPHR